MANEAICKTFGMINRQLEDRYQANNPILLDVNGKPRLDIFSLVPLVYETYGKLRNRAPSVAGSLALRAFITQPVYDTESVFLHFAMQAGDHIYGFPVNGHNPQMIDTVRDVTSLLGYPQLLGATDTN